MLGRITVTSERGVYLVEGKRRNGTRIAWYFGDARTAARVADRLRGERARKMETKDEERLYVCGTRRAVPSVETPGAWRVVCATCQDGGTVDYPTKRDAMRAATRDSGKPCPNRPPCGAE